MKPFIPSVFTAAAVALALLTPATSARANVYATGITINGYLNNQVAVSQGAPVAISYILNEAASAGVTIKIYSGATMVRTITIASGSGTTKGLNTVTWDGKDGSGVLVPLGVYSVTVTAGATGFSDWTQISDDGAPSSYMWRPRGLAVDNNTNSPYYGRVIIGQAGQGPGYSTNGWGDVPGFYKMNADGSYSDDGAGRYGTAGYNFSDATHYDGGDNPIDIKIKEDDRIYWNNWVGRGEIVAGDVLLTTNQIVMPESYYTGNPYFPGDNWKSFQITDILSDHPRLYLCDANYPSAGAWYWPMKDGAIDQADPSALSGYQAVQTGGDLSLRCDGIAIDAQTNVYVIQNRANPGDVNMRAACFTNWDMVTPLLSGASWVVGGADDTFRYQYCLALDSVQHPRYLAVSMSALVTNSMSDNVGWAGIRILDCTNGATVVSNLTILSSYHSVNWDNVGNLYGGSQSAHRWRVFSPPGANQATTPAISTMKVVTPIVITKITPAAGTVTIRFTGDPADAGTAFTLKSSLAAAGPYTPATGASAVTVVSPGVFEVSVPRTDPAAYYRIMR